MSRLHARRARDVRYQSPIMKSAPVLLALLIVGTARAASPKAPEAPEPPAVFEKLKALAGSWRGNTGGLDYRVTAGGTVVMETMFPGTAQETVSMYFVDRGRLILTQYSAIGNQPEMVYDRKHSTSGEFFFKFDGGRGFTMRDDLHMHDGTIKLTEPNHLEATWNVWNQGKPASVQHFVLTRAAR